jgi:hypothetical protein
VLAVDTGNDTAALAARERLAPLLAGIQEHPVRHPVPGRACLAGAGGGRPGAGGAAEGAAEGLRGRVGLPAWPLLRRLEAELVARVRQRLGVGQ